MKMASAMSWVFWIGVLVGNQYSEKKRDKNQHKRSSKTEILLKYSGILWCCLETNVDSLRVGCCSHCLSFAFYEKLFTLKEKLHKNVCRTT